MTEDWDKLKKSVSYYNKEEFIPRRDVRNTINYLIDAGDMSKGKAEKWDKAQELLDVLIRYGVIVPFEDGWKVLPAALNVQPSTETTT